MKYVTITRKFAANGEASSFAYEEGEKTEWKLPFGLERDLPFAPAIAAGLVDKFLEWVAFPGELMFVEGRIRPKARIFAI